MTGFKEYLNNIFGTVKSGDYPPKLQRQKIIWLTLIIAFAILLLIIGNTGKSGKTPGGTTENTDQQILQTDNHSVMYREEKTLAVKLKNILKEIEGVGELDVTVRLASSEHDQYAVNTSSSKKTTEEKDQVGGARSITEYTDSGQLVFTRNGQEETPVVEQTGSSKVAGVLVVAQGAKDPEIKAQLFEAVQVALGIEPQKVLVLPKS